MAKKPLYQFPSLFPRESRMTNASYRYANRVAYILIVGAYLIFGRLD
jgi:hypothetical protein